MPPAITRINFPTCSFTSHVSLASTRSVVVVVDAGIKLFAAVISTSNVVEPQTPLIVYPVFQAASVAPDTVITSPVFNMLFIVVVIVPTVPTLSTLIVQKEPVLLVVPNTPGA